MALEVGIPALIANTVANHFTTNELGRVEPGPTPSKDAYQQLLNAATNRASSIAPDASPLLVANQEYILPKDGPVDYGSAAKHVTAYTKDGTPVSKITINPNADRSLYAHELGHAVSQKTKIGKFVNDSKKALRSNPKLARALAIALPGALAGTGAALQAGDDDLLGSIGLAAAAASPTLIDEALASKNALAIMNDAGMRANAGQRGRLAGAYMSYLAPVLMAGSVGNFVGNVADDYTALYDL